MARSTRDRERFDDKLVFVFFVISAVLLFYYGIAILSDPLTLNLKAAQFSPSRLLLVLFLVFWSLLILVGFWRKQKKISFVSIVIVLVICSLGASTRWGGFVTKKETLELETVRAFAEEKRLGALDCLSRGQYLYNPVTSKTQRQVRSITQGVQYPLCAGSEVSWAYAGRQESLGFAPIGWRYRSDFEMGLSNDTSDFSLVSRRGEIISCTSKKCVVK